MNGGQHLAGLEPGGQVVDEQLLGRQAPLAGLAAQRDRRVEGDQHRRRILGRVGVREVAAERRLVADAHRGDLPERLAQRGRIGADLRRQLELAVGGERPDPEAAIVLGRDPVQLGDLAQRDHVLRLHQPHRHQQDHRRAAGDQVGVLVAVGGEQVERLRETLRLVQGVRTASADPERLRAARAVRTCGLGGGEDALDDLVVARAAAEVAHHPVAHLLGRRAWLLRQQGGRGDDLAGGADTALESAVAG